MIPFGTTDQAPPETIIPRHYPYADILFDYADFLRSVETNNGIANYTAGTGSVAIIGSGMGGIVAGYELLRAGMPTVDIYSADDEKIRPYGRMNALPFDHQDPTGRPLVAELGGMRFPISEVGFFHYLDKMGITAKDDFPDPGLVRTLLSVSGRSSVWEAGEAPPAMFTKVAKGWHAFLDEGYTHKGQKLASLNSIADDLQNMRIEQAAQKWQDWLTAFISHSFYSGVVEIFQKSDNPPGGENWTDEDMELFGTLGLGSGGFKPVLHVAFSECMRLIANGLEVRQQFIPDGSDAVLHRLATSPVGASGKILKDNIIYLNEPNALIDIQSVDGQYQVTVGSAPTKTYDHVIINVPVWSLQANFKGGINALRKLQLMPNVTSLGEQQCTAITDQHVIASTKVFVLTKDKFWLKDPETFSNIQSDTLTHGFYGLDYNPQNSDGYGVVLLSYTWENDAHKLAGYATLSDEQKAHRLLDCLEQIDGAKPTADAVRHGMLEVKIIEWMNTPNYHGGFRLPGVGKEVGTQKLFWDFLKVKNPTTDSKLYLVGDSFTYNAGWVESAIQTSLNAVTAILYGAIRDGKADSMVKYNPVDYSYENRYDYSISQKQTHL